MSFADARSTSIKGLIRQAIARSASAGAFDRPVFIIAPPRSGSTLLFEGLRRAPGVLHLDGEADLIWWRHFPYDRLREPSDLVRADETDAAAELCRDLYRETVVQSWRRGSLEQAWRRLLGRGRIRYLDKTIANCFHLGLLHRLFPDALYVHLVRDPRANIASMMEGWSCVARFGKPMLTPYIQALPKRRIEHWTYPAPPGWTEVVDRPLVEICAWSWQQHVEAALRHFAAAGIRPLQVRYEDLIREPAQVFRCLAGELRFGWSAALEAYAAERPLSPTTLSAPARDKWRSVSRALERVLPGLEDTAARIGYGGLAEPTGQIVPTGSALALAAEADVRC